MFNLLNDTEKRRLDFARILSKRGNWNTISELAEELEVSDRVLRDDIAHFRKNFTCLNLETSTDGVRLNFTEGKSIKFIYRTILGDSLAYKILEEIFLNETHSINELAEELFASYSTLYRVIRSLNKRLEPYHFQIQTNPCRIVGDEDKIRYFFYQYFAEKYSPFDWAFDMVDEAALDDLLQFFIDFSEMEVDFAHYNIFKLTTLVNLVRYKHNHLVDTETIVDNFGEIVPDLSVFADKFAEFEKAFAVNFDMDFIFQVFTAYIQEGFSLNVERLALKVELNETVAKEVHFLEEMLEGLAQRHDLALPNKEYLTLSLHNTAHLEYREPQSGYILYNRNQYFAEAVSAEFPDFYQDAYECMKDYRKIMGKPITEDGIQFYIYMLFTYWDHLVTSLKQKLKKVITLIISNRHISHANMLKDYIEYEFSNVLTVDIYTGVNLSQEAIEKLDYDFLISNFPIPDVETKEILYIDSVPNFNDLLKIQDTIDEVIEHRIHTNSHQVNNNS